MTRKLANGICCFGPATFVSAAFILSQFGSKGCEYIQLGDPNEVSDFFLRNQVDYAGLYCFHTQSGVNYMYSDVSSTPMSTP
eukprot:g2025.t1 g2025   contig11:556833-557509(-)